MKCPINYNHELFKKVNEAINGLMITQKNLETQSKEASKAMKKFESIINSINIKRKF